MKKTMFNQNKDSPAAFLDEHGNILTLDKAIQARVLEFYNKRLKRNAMEIRLEEYEKEVKELCDTRLNVS